MLIAQMVVRNEEERYLEEVLEHTSKIVDLIVVTDDHSTDNTVEICRSYGAKVIETGENLFVKDESKLRTFAWKHLEKYASQGDWILALDADEMFYPTEQLDGWMASNYGVLGVEFYHMWDETHYRVDKAWKPAISSRLFRFKEGGYFKLKRLACGAEPTYVSKLIQAGFFAPHTGFKMKHLGYAEDDDKIIKHERYMALDGGKYHAKTHIESIVEAATLREWTYG